MNYNFGFRILDFRFARKKFTDWELNPESKIPNCQYKIK